MKWIKIILLCCIVSIISCRKMIINPTPQTEEIKDIFKVKQVVVSNETPLNFTLSSDGFYTLTLFDTIVQQVLTRERIAGKIGQNKINIYTKTLSARYLYLSLEDENNNQVGKTLLVIN